MQGSCESSDVMPRWNLRRCSAAEAFLCADDLRFHRRLPHAAAPQRIAGLSLRNSLAHSQPGRTTQKISTRFAGLCLRASSLSHGSASPAHQVAPLLTAPPKITLAPDLWTSASPGSPSRSPGGSRGGKQHGSPAPSSARNHRAQRG